VLPDRQIQKRFHLAISIMDMRAILGHGLGRRGQLAVHDDVKMSMAVIHPTW